MKSKKLDVITCPYCGTEYLPAEIYLPTDFVGKPREIERGEDGKIKSFQGKTMNLNEKYECDRCGKPLNISAKITFKVDINSAEDFTEDYVSPLHEQKISLFEV